MPKSTSHPSPEQLSAFSLGQLPPDKAVVIESHISECEPCCETIAGLNADDTFVALLQEARQLTADQVRDQAGRSAVSDPVSAEIPTALAEHPRYEVTRLIGKGGMGDVYQAKHRMMERTVALKIINRRLVSKSAAVDRFHREVKTAAQLSHPNIVTAYDAEQADDVHFLVMEHVDGTDLACTVNERGALPIADACDFIRQAAKGLQYAHERGMVHRDIKPHNLMVTADGTVKILDFGIASLAPESSLDAERGEGNSDLTAVGTIMGTPDFISPEQADDARQADIRSDIYSLGTTLYFLLAGRPPFAEGNVTDKLKSHAQIDPTPLHTVRDDVPPDLAAAVERMIAKDPDDRFQTPAEVAESLALFCAGLPERRGVTDQNARPHRTKAEPTKSTPGRGPITAVAFVGVALAFIAATVFFIQSGKTTLRFEINDPDVAVRFDDETISVDTPDNKTFQVKPSTEHKFVVYQNGVEVETDSLTLRRGQKIVLKIDVVQGQIRVTSSGANAQITQTNRKRHDATRSADAENDHENIQGTWQVTYSEDKGRIAPQDELKDLQIVIKQNTISQGSGEDRSETIYRLDPSATPKAIDVTEEGKTILGIYDLQGDTLRLCVTDPEKGKRPTAFDTRPDSKYDILILLKRVGPVDNTPNQGKSKASDLSPSAASKLFPEAASISNEDFQRLMQAPDPTKFENQSLSLVLISLNPIEQAVQKPAVANDFRFLTDMIPKPETLAEAMWTSQWRGFASLIQPEYITKVVCETSNGTATGKVAFKADGLYAGTVEFTARRNDGSWRIEEFRLPHYGIKLIRGTDGIWSKSSRDSRRGVASNVVRVQIKNLEQALQVYRLDHGVYPSSAEGLQSLMQAPVNEKQTTKWRGPYLRELVADPWGNPFAYESPSPPDGKPHIWSRGPDGKDNTDDDIRNWHPERE